MSEHSVLSKKRLRCREIMSTNVSSADPGTNLKEIANILKKSDIGALPLVEKATGRLVGLITDRDIVVRAVADGMDVTNTTAHEVMTTELFTGRADDFVFEAVRTMAEKQVRRVPIVDEEGILTGMVSMADIALEMEDEKEVAETLEEISSGAAFWKKR
jgi:CBS domain-containing protein